MIFRCWFSKLPYSAMTLGKSSRSCTYTLFLPQEVEIKLIFAPQKAVSEIWADFQILKSFKSWSWNLDFEERSQSCICTLFLPRGLNLSLFSLYRQPFSRCGPVFNISIFGHEIWNSRKGPKVAYFSTPGGLHLSLFLLYGSPFRDTGQFSTFPYLGMKSGIWRKVPKLHICSLFLPPSGQN